MEIVRKVNGACCVLTLLLVCMLFSCAGGTINPHITDGWANDDIYRVTVSGIMQTEPLSAEDAKIFVYNDAIKRAQSLIIDRFVGEYFEGSESTRDPVDLADDMKKIFLPIVSAGTVLKAVYSGSGTSLACSVVYEVTSPHLRNKVWACTTDERRLPR